ncbi:MAG TPA: mycofactocin biosynthesis chaperone MftB [Acidimicrobiales bacterium]|jgi:putative mycofactocin binding protein MftB|nr:mycofactocin biosynthesis chaperone MftB [Acidimicrobiales bacterium]
MVCAGSTDSGFDPGRPYELHPDVALRPEPFGALAYHYGNRRLTFLRSTELVGLVEVIGSYGSASECMAALGIDAARVPAMVGALASLEMSGVLRPRTGCAA